MSSITNKKNFERKSFIEIFKVIEKNTNKQIQIKIRSMLLEDVINAVNCFNDNYDVFDCPSTIKIILQLDLKAFFIAELIDDYDDDDDRQTSSSTIVGCCGIPEGPEQTHIFGLYGVHKRYRGLGIGTKLFKLAMNYANGKNVCLAAVPDMFEKYMNIGGFSLKENVSIVNYRGIPKLDQRQQITTINKENIQIVHLLPGKNEQYLFKLVNYDKKIYPLNNEKRHELLKNLLKNDSNYQFCLLLDQNDNSIKGFGGLCLHQLSKRFYISPLYADTIEMAQLILMELFHKNHKHINQYGIIWYTISSNQNSINLITKQFQLKEYIRCERLFTKHLININYNYIYAILSPDFFP